MKRIMIIGGQGAGKTTLALRLGKITGLPVVHIDKSYHLPRWKVRPQAAALAELEGYANSERWIMDGDDFRSFGPRLKRAELIIYLHVSTLRRVARVIKRAVQSFDKPRVDLPDGCRGKVSFGGLKWAAYGYPMKIRPAMHKAMAQVDVPVFHLRSESDVEKLETKLAVRG
ncbi:MAG: DNA topology modulation protein FlaR [Rhodobacteraceae bacterium]|nr:DNA topology modulation protein FlaR [Paracoccaceae bacterium]